MKEKKISVVKIEKNEPIAENVYRMEISSSEIALSAKSGQFVNVYLNNPSKLLPRPISVCRASGDTLTLVYGVVGDGTKELAAYEAGTEIRISVALGNGYDLAKVTVGHKALIAGGGIGVPPMLQLAAALKKNGAQVTAVLGFKDEPFLVEELEATGAMVHIATDSGNAGFHGNVVQLIQEEQLCADHYFACGPKVMLKALTEYLTEQQADVQVSMEERMGCGFGACVGCVCDVYDEDGNVVKKKVCKDGPVFWGSEVVWDGK